jgi:hypothetical protein
MIASRNKGPGKWSVATYALQWTGTTTISLLMGRDIGIMVGIGYDAPSYGPHDPYARSEF